MPFMNQAQIWETGQSDQVFLILKLKNYKVFLLLWDDSQMW